MNIENKILYFKNDDEFTNFCLSPDPVFSYGKDMNTLFYNYEFSKHFMYYVKNGHKFKIEDPKSKVRKRQCVCRGVVTKPLPKCLL